MCLHRTTRPVNRKKLQLPMTREDYQKKKLPRSVKKPLSGLMLTSWPKLMSSKINKKKLKGSATQSSQNYTNRPVEHQVACLEVCQVVCQEACQEVCQVVQEEQEPEALVELEGQPS